MFDTYRQIGADGLEVADHKTCWQNGQQQADQGLHDQIQRQIGEGLADEAEVGTVLKKLGEFWVDNYI